MRTLAPLLALVLTAPAAFPAAAQVPRPADLLGHRVGADRQMAPWPRVLEILRAIDAASDRVSIEAAGTSTLGNEMPVVVLTSPANQARLERIREINRRLALPTGLTAEEEASLVQEGRVTALVTCTIHATEIGCTQMAMQFVYEVATSDDPEVLAWLEEAVLLLMPSINPDGQVLVRDWYQEHLGSEHEGGDMPWLYHHYVGHDNNRDFYMLTQAESRVVNDVLYHRWFPQVFLDEHQMGSTGPRMFVPPQTDPLAPEVHSLVFRQADLLGTNMSRRLEEAGKRGVGHDMIYDSYWPGGTRNTAWWKNVTGLLTEVASADIASPVYIEPTELRGGRKGLPEYGRRSNYPSPWEGGWWRLADIVEYERIATWAFLETLAENREEFLANMARMGRDAIAAGEDGPPYAWVVPPGQHDPVAAARLVELLLRHGIDVRQAAEPVTVGHATYPAGTPVIPAAQPYRPFLLTMLRPQRYPEVLPYVGGPVIPPYDVTSWSLPLAMGVEVVEAAQPVAGELATLAAPLWPKPDVASAAGGWALPHAADSVYPAMNRLLADGATLYWLASSHEGAARGDVWVPPGEIDATALARLATELHLPAVPLSAAPSGPAWRVKPARVGLYKPWVASMDEGWTRFLLERYEFPFVNVTNEEIRSGAFDRRADVLLFPDVEPAILAKGEPDEDDGGGRPWTPLPPPYAGGIDETPEEAARPGKDRGRNEEPEDEPAPGGERIAAWVKAGGAVVALDSSAGYFLEQLELPAIDALADASDVDAPGSMLRIHVDTSHPLAFGMRREEVAYFASSPAFRTFPPDARFDRRVVARYPDEDEDLLVSGYLEGGERLERLAAAVDFTVGQGRVTLIGFRAQHRAQPLRTFKLLFNALYRLEEVDLPGPGTEAAAVTPRR